MDTLALVSLGRHHKAAVLQLRLGCLGPLVAARACKEKQSKTDACSWHQVRVDLECVPKCGNLALTQIALARRGAVVEGLTVSRIDLDIPSGASPLKDGAEQHERMVGL